MANKKITPKTIKAAEKNIFSKKRMVTIVNKFGDSYNVTYDKEIKTTKLLRVLDELKDRMLILNKYNVQYDYTAHIYILLIKHFTDIEFPEIHCKTKDEIENSFRDEMSMMEALLDLDLYGRIMENFTEENLKDINEFIDNFLNNKDLELAQIALTNKLNEIVDSKDALIDFRDVEEYLQDDTDTI